MSVLAEDSGIASMDVLGDITNQKKRRVSLCDYIGAEKGSSDISAGKVSEGSKKQLSAKGQELLGLVEELSYYGGEYALSSTCMTFLDSLIKGKKSVTLAPPLKMESAAHSRFMDAIENFQKETEDYELAFKELEHAKKRVAEKEAKKEIASGFPSGINVASSQASGREIYLEMKKSEEILLKLKGQQDKANKLIAEKKMKRDQAQIALKLSLEDAEKAKRAVMVGSTAAAAYKANVNTAEDKFFQAEMRQISDQINNADALLAGLKVLSGISDLSVPKDPVVVQQQQMQGQQTQEVKVIPVTARLGRLTCVFTLQVPSLCLLAVEVVEGRLNMDESASAININQQPKTNEDSANNAVLAQVLADARVLPAPQDLRYAVFAMQSAQAAPVVFANHLQELRKRCIVRATGPLSMEFTLSSGVTAAVSAHPFYPNVPAAVAVTSLIGVGGWEQTELDSVRGAANNKCLSSLGDMFDYLSGKKALGR